MQSANVLLGKRIIGKYPEVFDALLEYERTLKLPKLYRRKKLTVTIDENVLRDFKNHARKEGINISRFIEKRMVEKMKN